MSLNLFCFVCCIGFMLVVTFATIGSMDLALALLKQWPKQWQSTNVTNVEMPVTTAKFTAFANSLTTRHSEYNFLMSILGVWDMMHANYRCLMNAQFLMRKLERLAKWSHFRRLHVWLLKVKEVIDKVIVTKPFCWDFIFFYRCRFYIGCENCSDWFHGRCVGILQCEADRIEEYICPRCDPNSKLNVPNQKKLTAEDCEAIKRLVKQLLVSSKINALSSFLDLD